MPTGSGRPSQGANEEDDDGVAVGDEALDEFHPNDE